jgi:AcrR family transcriptional regulator
MYSCRVPRLWTETIEEHRRAVHDATLDTTAALVREHGLAAVTMSQIAAAAGIGRATLYKYFPDVEAILVAWHDRHIALHLRQLSAARDAVGTPAEQLEAVLTEFALIQHEHHDTELPVSLLHRGEHVARARQQLQDLVADLLATGAQAGQIRADMAPGELAGYCLHALTAAGTLPSEVAVRRLLAVTMAGLRADAAVQLAQRSAPLTGENHHQDSLGAVEA